MITGLHRNELVRITCASKWYGTYCVFDNISLTVSEKERITIVGENGIGKSTLLKIIVGQTDLSSGVIRCRENISIGYLPQEPLLDHSKSVLEFVTEGLPALAVVAKQLLAKQAILKNSCTNQQETYNELKLIRSAFNEQGGYKVSQILFGLNITHIPWERSLFETSGGEQMRFALAKLLLQEPDLLVLDEPINHLDSQAITWLEKYLYKVQSSIILATHDRMFLSTITRHIIEIDSKSKQLLSFRGKYQDFLMEKKRKQQQALQTYYELKKEAKLLKVVVEEQAYRLTIKPPMKDNNKPGYDARGERCQSTTTRKIEKSMLRLEAINQLIASKPEKIKTLAWTLPSNNPNNAAQPICRFNDIKKTIDGKEILMGCRGVIYPGQKIVLQGVNGSGKTTLLRILVNEIQADFGDVSCAPDIKFGYLPQFCTWDGTNNVFDVFKEGVHVSLSEEACLALLYAYCLFEPEFAYKPIKELSIGKQRRLQLALILMQHPDFLILDEPTNHLDYMSCDYLEAQLSSFQGALLAVSHDRYFTHKLNPVIWQLNQGKLEQLVCTNQIGSKA